MPNKRPPKVRERGRPPRLDARAARSQLALGRALVALMTDTAFDAITVQQVLDRAGVGRATFYAHFRNKDDLLLSDAERFIDMLARHFTGVAAGTTRVAPVVELFSHVEDVARFIAALDRSGRQDAVFELLLGHLAQIIERRLDILVPNRDALALGHSGSARICAAMAMEMLRWFRDHPGAATAKEMDQRYHAMVWRGLSSGGGQRSAM